MPLRDRSAPHSRLLRSAICTLIEKWTNYSKNEEERNAVEKEPIAKALTNYANQVKALFDESKVLTEQIKQAS